MGYTQLDILDPYGSRLVTLAGGRVTGPARAVRGVSYIPYGGVANSMGSLSFRVPLRDRHNLPITEGTVIKVKDSDLGEMGRYIVESQSEQQDGLDAAFACPELMQELNWQTLPGFQAAPGETPATTVARLGALQIERPWSGKFLGAAVDYTGVAFVADKISIYQAYQQLYTERGYNFRSAADRVIEVGDFGEPSGIRLSTASPIPALMRRGNVRPIIDGGLNPKWDAGGVVNMIIPSAGGGTGFAALDLGTLYNPVGEIAFTIGAYSMKWYMTGPCSFAGYDPTYPIWRRARYDGNGWEYFLWDYAQQSIYRIRMAALPISHVTPVSGAAADVQAAVAALYITAKNELRFRTVKNLAYDIKTAANGDIRGMAGKVVQVYAPASRILNDQRRVVRVQRDVDDTTGKGTDSWIVSSSGRDVTSASTIQTGILQNIDYMRTMPAVYPARSSFPGFANIDVNNQHDFVIPGDTSIMNRVAVLLTINCVPAVSPVSTAAAKGHTHTVTIPPLSISGSISGGAHSHNGATSAPSTVSGSTNGSTVSGTASPANIGGVPRHAHRWVTKNQNNNYTIQSVPVGLAPTGYLWVKSADGTMYSNNAATVINTTDEVLQATDLSPTSHPHGVGGTATGQIIGTASAATQGITQYDGFSITGVTTTASVTTATGGEHTHDLAWGVMRGPVPTFVSVLLDGNYVLFQINSPADGRRTATIDLTAATNDQKDHTVSITALTMGGVSYFLNERHRETTYSAA